MRNPILLPVLICALTACSGKKHNYSYTSTEEDEYYKSRTYKAFQPARRSYIDSLTYDFLSIKPSPVTNKFKSAWQGTLFNQYYDSLMRTCRGSGCFDSLRKIQYSHKTGEIFNYSIVRYDSLDSLKVIFYESSELEDRELGYWVAVSNDFGRSWKRYYTTLVKNNFYFVKPTSKIPFVKNHSTLQLEFAIIRKTKQETLPVGPPEFELLEDDLIMEIDLTKLIRDTDGDGLTDLLESKLFLDTGNKDTDRDGVNDRLDKNPRYKNKQGNYSLLYHYLLEHARSDSVFISFDDPDFDLPKIKYQDTIVHTYLIITEDPDLLHLDGTKNRYILMRRGEYDVYTKKHYCSPARLFISPLFGIDNDADCRKVHVSRDISGHDYIITEDNNGWIVKYIGGYII